MLTRSTVYEEFAERLGIQSDTIVKITKGGNTYLFSYRPMPKGLDTNPIYPILKKCAKIGESIDIYSKRLGYSSVTITLSDIPFYPSANAAPLRASELLTSINGSTVDIYFLAGNEIEDIDDCLHVFSGYVLTAPKLSRETFTMEVENKIKIEDIVIPQRVIRDEVATAPTEFKNIPIPLIYGYFHLGTEKDWTSDLILNYPGTGLAKGIPTSGNRYAYYIVGDHALTVYEAFFDLGGPTVVWIEYPQYSYTASNSRLLVKPEAIEHICSLVFPIDADLPGIYDAETYHAENPSNAEIYVLGLVATFKDNKLDNTNTMQGEGCWSFAHPELFAKHFALADVIKAFYHSITAKAGVTLDLINAYLYYGREDASDDAVVIGSATSSITYGSGAYEIDNTGKSKTDASSALDDEYVMSMLVQSNNNEGDSVLDNQEMLDINKFFAKLCWTLKERPDEIWVTCKGERYAAWIEAAGRDNPGNHQSGYAIQHIIYIIESLYRLQLGFDDDDIDTDSFDNAYEEELEARINIMEQKSFSEYIRKLCEQSTFTIVHSSTGKVRAVKLNDPSPTTSATIERHHLIKDAMTIIKASRLINDLTVHSNWHAQYNKFLDRDNYQDASSISSYRTRSAEYKWENITGAAAEHVAEAYVNSVDGLWSKEHIQAHFATFGLIHSHLEVGDWIAISTDLDDLRAPFGGTWYGKSLLITDIRKSDILTEIEAVEIIAYEHSPEPSVSPSPSPSPVEDGLWLLDDDTDPANSTLLTGYSALLDGIYNAVACRPFTDGPSVGIDMGEQATLSALRLYDTGIAGAGLKTGSQLKLYISNDNATWTYIETFSSMTRVATGGTNDPYYIDCVFTSDQTARYFKLYSPGEPLKSAAEYNLDLSEIEETLSPSPSP